MRFSVAVQDALNLYEVDIKVNECEAPRSSVTGFAQVVFCRAFGAVVFAAVYPGLTPWAIFVTPLRG